VYQVDWKAADFVLWTFIQNNIQTYSICIATYNQEKQATFKRKRILKSDTPQQPVESEGRHIICILFHYVV
jgi:hypothetical protein